MPINSSTQVKIFLKLYSVYKILTQTFSEKFMYLWSFFLELH